METLVALQSDPLAHLGLESYRPLRRFYLS